MANLDVPTITGKSIKGILVLTLAQVLNTVLVFLLTIFIDPRNFGVFIVVSAALSFLVYFGDFGLAAALIQKKEKLTREDLVTTFTIQELLVLIIVSVGFLFSGFVANLYDLDIPGTRLFQALLISFFLSSLKTIPSVILERNLEFKKVVIPQVAEALVFNSLAVLLFIKGFGTTSFTFAVLARSVVGVLLMYLIAPWKPGVAIFLPSAKKLLSFGLPFQVNSLLALVKDDLLIIVLGRILTLTEVGFIGFAQKVAYMPLRLVMDKLIRVTFPAFSRLQEDTKTLKLGVEKTLFVISLLIFPATLGIIVLAPYAIHIIPKYTKWEYALPSLTFFAVNALLSSISTPLTNMLNAIGKIRMTLNLMIFWTVATWALTLLLIQVMGFLGVSVASAIVASSVVGVVYIVRKHIVFDIIKPISAPVVSSIIMGVILYFVSPLFVTNTPTLILAILLGGVLYLGILYLISREEMKADLRTLFKHLRYSPPKSKTF